MAILPTYVTAYTLTSALGVGNQATLKSIQAKKGGLAEYQMGKLGNTWFGFVDASQMAPLAEPESSFDNDCNRMVNAALSKDHFRDAVELAKLKYGKHRIACFLGTITSGICHVEDEYKRNQVSLDSAPNINFEKSGSLNSAALYTRHTLGITGPYATIGTACSSSAKVFAAAYRYLQLGLCDAAIVAGVETFSETLVHGFRSLSVLSKQPCKPWDESRDGISIGAAAGFALLERDPLRNNDIRLMGYGETADGFHMTAPHPEGKGIENAMLAALRSAELNPADIDYINAHGSGTPMNDQAEDAALVRLFGDKPYCSSTKGWTGHTQGAAGITEAIILMLGMENNLVPASLNTEKVDPALKSNIALDNQSTPIRYALTNSMGFGGNNATLIFGRDYV